LPSISVLTAVTKLLYASRTGVSLMFLDQMGRQAQQDVTAEWTPCSDAGQTDTDHVRLAYHHQQTLDDPDAVACPQYQRYHDCRVSCDEGRKIEQEPGSSCQDHLFASQSCTADYKYCTVAGLICNAGVVQEDATVVLRQDLNLG